MSEKIYGVVNKVVYYNEDNGFEWAEDFIDSLSCKVTISMGATKLVLIPEKENFVLKIPFFGRYCEVWKENEDYTLSYSDPDYDSSEAGYYDNEFYPFELAAVREGDAIWDYCAAETTIYELAEAEGLESYFAAEYLLGFIQETPVYVQDKVCACEDATLSPYRSLNSADAKRVRHYLSNGSPERCVKFPNMWINHFIRVYGEEELNRLVEFLILHKINDDWHMGNLAYIEDDAEYPIPIILDYSNYND